MNIKSTTAVAKFNCLQADCPDTCCKGWSMQLDDKTFEVYKGTDLENAVSYDGEHKEIRVMKRNPETDYCVKFVDGICSIHKQFGATMLGDACNFYPRVTRRLGNETLVTATLSCPEIARLSLFEENAAPEHFETLSTERLPVTLKNYLPEDVGEEDAINIHLAFINSCNADAKPERIMARICSAAQSLQYIKKTDWAGAAPFMIKMADGKLPTPEIDIFDLPHLLQLFAGIFHATRKKMNQRLGDVVSKIEAALGIRINWETLEIEQVDNSSLTATVRSWIENKAEYDSLLKKYIKAELSFTTFPFAGLGQSLHDKARLLTLKFALTRLAIMSVRPHDEKAVIDCIQPLARVIDHIGDPALTFSLMEQFGWNTESRLRGLLWDEN